MIKLARQALAEGHAVVIGLQTTGESGLTRALERSVDGSFDVSENGWS